MSQSFNAQTLEMLEEAKVLLKQKHTIANELAGLSAMLAITSPFSKVDVEQLLVASQLAVEIAEGATLLTEALEASLNISSGLEQVIALKAMRIVLLEAQIDAQAQSREARVAELLRKSTKHD